jgi:hypothetical protein
MLISSPKLVLTCKWTNFIGFRSPSPVRLCPSCLRRFGDLRKNTPWKCEACILWILSMFVDFRIPPSTPWSMCLPQALFFLKKHAPGFWEHASCGFCQYLENFVVIRAGGTRAQGLGEPPGGRRGNRWAVLPEGIPESRK